MEELTSHYTAKFKELNSEIDESISLFLKIIKESPEALMKLKAQINKHMVNEGFPPIGFRQLSIYITCLIDGEDYKIDFESKLILLEQIEIFSHGSKKT